MGYLPKVRSTGNMDAMSRGLNTLAKLPEPSKKSTPLREEHEPAPGIVILETAGTVSQRSDIHTFGDLLETFGGVEQELDPVVPLEKLIESGPSLAAKALAGLRKQGR